MQLDPGEHRLLLQRQHGPVINQAVVVSLGEKNRLVRVTLDDEPARSVAAVVPEPPRRASLLPWVLGGLAIGAAASGATLDLVGSSERL